MKSKRKLTTEQERKLDMWGKAIDAAQHALDNGCSHREAERRDKQITARRLEFLNSLKHGGRAA